MLAFARKSFALLAGLFVAVGVFAAFHVVGTRISTSTAASAILAPVVTPPVTPVNTKVGMNLATLSYYTKEAPLLNRAKLSGAWSVRGVTTDPSWLNADGYPIAMPPGGGQWEAIVPLDPATGTNFPQTYILRWKGTGAMAFGYVDNVINGDHQISFTNTQGVLLYAITATDPNDPVRDISIVRSDQVADYDAGKIFNQSFVDRVVKPFASVRTMDWDLINNSNEANWTDRQKPTDATWTRMPLEMEVALANQAGVDLWKTIPAHASDDYVRQTLAYIKANLSPTLKLHLEYSNEMWNSSFQQTSWAGAQAQALWKISNWGANTFYGYRAAQIASIAWSTFGAGSTQLKPVIAGWYGWSGPEVTDAMTLGVSFAKQGSVGTLFREYAIAPYFGDALGAGYGNEADRAIVLGWANDPTPAGLASAFQQLEHGGLLAAQGTSLDDAKFNFEPHHSAWAKQNGLSLVTYEGGLSFYFFLADPATKPALLAFFNRLVADPRMGQLYTRWMQDFTANGGTLIENYTDVGALGEYGPWGVLPDIYAPDTPRYSALRAMSAL